VKYLLLINVDESADVIPAEASADAWVNEMTDRRVRLLGSQLRPTRDTTTVRIRDGELLLTDGPFAEAKEEMAGFDLLECSDLDEAIEVASKHPVARFGTVQIRPLVED
jgi:hypothetical protein